MMILTLIDSFSMYVDFRTWVEGTCDLCTALTEKKKVVAYFKNPFVCVD
jgi:hypothetical protein